MERLTPRTAWSIVYIAKSKAYTPEFEFCDRETGSVLADKIGVRYLPIASPLSNAIDGNFSSWDATLFSFSMAQAEVTRADSNKQLVDTLRRSKLFRSYEQVFSEATGLALSLRPVDYWQLEHQGKKNENPFCALLAQRPATLSVCLRAHEQMIRHTGDLPHTVTCPFGLTETAVPIKLGEQTIGYLRIGQVLRHMPAKSDTTKVSRELERCGVRFGGELRKAWEKNPLIPPEKYNAIVRLLAFFADQLSALSNQLMTEKKNSEPPLVLKAREYIDKHKTEELSLADVAKASGASVFHFCKVFHKSTGLKFTDYVARVRLEDARTRLLNPNLRVSEIAYDVGFQSLTQFNRTFKRVFGQSPSEFRMRVSSRKRANKAA
jgi:AraC-like DNA-binding protein/ligand-binding sensor protein